MKAIASVVFGTVAMCLSAWQPSRSAEATPIEALSRYRGWKGFDTWIGPHVSQAYLEVEAAAF